MILGCVRGRLGALSSAALCAVTRDWASYATSCETIATQMKTTDWEDVLDMDAEDASELQAWAHTVAKMCEKVKRGWS